MIKRILLLLFLLPGSFAIAQYHEIIKIKRSLPEIKDSKAKINALNKIGLLYYFRRIDSSYYYAAKARAMAEKIGYQRGIADAYKVNGVLLIGENNYLAAKYFNNALDIYRNINDKEDECMVLINISNLLYVDNDTTRAYNYAQRAYTIGKQLTKDSVQSGIIINLIYHRQTLQKVKDHSLDSLMRTGMAIARKYNDERAMMGYRQMQAVFLWDSGKHKDALDFAMKSIAMADSVGNVYSKINFYIELGDWMANGDAFTSAGYYKQALNYSITNKYNFLTGIIAQKLYDYYNSIHQTSEALKYASTIIDVNQKIQSDLKKSGFEALNYVIKDNELKIAQVKQKASEKILVVFIVLFALLIVLLFFIYRSYLINKRYTKTERALSESTYIRNQELETWNNFNNMLIAILAHDLRQPFSSIIMMAELMNHKNQLLSEEELKDIMLDLKGTSFKSIELLEGLLCWVSSKKEGYEYKPQPLLLNDIILESNGLYEYDQQKRNISLIIEIPEKQIIYAHKQMLLFINRNIISNATKYSSAHNAIRIYSVENNNEIIVAFENKGKGMTEVQIKNLFTMKEKIKMEGTAVKGAGIALNICYDMIQQMNGRLWVESVMNNYTTFYYALPIQRLV